MTTYSCAIQPIFSARVNKPTLVWTLNVISCITVRVAVFLHCTALEYEKYRTKFLMKHASSTWSVHYGKITHAWTVFYVGIVIYHFLFIVQKSGSGKSADSARWRKLVPSTTNIYAEITSCWQNDTSRDTPEQNGSSAWLGLGFTLHPTVISTLVTYPFQPTTLSSKSSEQ
jgi:hypothetical protein